VSAVVLGPGSADVHRSIKDALDPAGLPNPAKVLPRLPR
jgi:glycolate oxidase